MKPKTKVIVLLLYCILTAISIYGTINLRAWHYREMYVNNPEQFSSYDFYQLKEKYFSEKGLQTIIYVQGNNYTDFFSDSSQILLYRLEEAL